MKPGVIALQSGGLNGAGSRGGIAAHIDAEGKNDRKQNDSCKTTEFLVLPGGLFQFAANKGNIFLVVGFVLRRLRAQIVTRLQYILQVRLVVRVQLFVVLVALCWYGEDCIGLI